MQIPTTVLESWCHTATSEDRTMVLPDGCRDLILRVVPGQAPQWLIAPLADAAYAVSSVIGEQFWGYRFHPGATVDEDALLKAVVAKCKQISGMQDVHACVDEFVRLDARVVEALHGLSDTPYVAGAARQLGVSERSLQRLVCGATGRSPVYWKSLARVRGAARALSCGAPLVAIAADHGYADQAHMSREFKRWFDCSPRQLQRSPTLLAVAMASGYG